MCRGSNLGICCAQGCDDRIACQDTGGYCNEHNPYVYDWVEDDDENEIAEWAPAVVDDPEKRRTYDLTRLTAAIARSEAGIRADQHRLAEMRTRALELERNAP